MTGTLELVEFERIDSAYGSRFFFEDIDDIIPSVFTGTATLGSSSHTSSLTLQAGVGTLGPAGTNGINVTNGSMYGVCAAHAEREDQENLSSVHFYGPLYTQTASFDVANSCSGCDFTIGSASSSSTGCSAGSGAVSATTPNITNIAGAYCAHAYYEQRYHYPHTEVTGEVKQKSIGGVDLASPYSTTGTGYWAYEDHVSGVTVKYYDKSLPSTITVEYGYGETMAATWFTSQQLVDANPFPPAPDQTFVYAPYASGVAPTGTLWVPVGTSPGAPTVPSLCALSSVGSLADGASSGSDAFAPASPFVGGPNITNNYATVGVTFTQPATLPIANFPFLSGSPLFSGTWAVVGVGSSITESTPNLIIAAGSAPADAMLTFSSGIPSGYRFLRARVSQGGSPTAAINVTVRASYGFGAMHPIACEATISVPTSGSVDIVGDVLQRIQSISATAVHPSPSGIFLIQYVDIIVPSGATLLVSEIAWIREHHSYVSAMPAIGTADLPGLYGVTDGMPSMGFDRLDATVANVITKLAARPTAGWLGTYFGPPGTVITDVPLTDIDVATGIGSNTPTLDADATTSLAMRAGRTSFGVIGYFGCGNPHTGGAYGDMHVEWDIYSGNQITVTIVDLRATTGAAHAATTRHAGGASLSSATIADDGSERYHTLAPDIIEISLTDTQLTEHVARMVLGGIGSQLGAIYKYTGDEDCTRTWVAFVVADRPSQSFMPISVDDVRQLLQIGWNPTAVTDPTVRVYHVFNLASARSDTASTAVETWEKFAMNERQSALYLSGKEPAMDQRNIYRSRDAGTNISEVTTVTAKSLAMAVDDTRQWVILVYQDATTDGLMQQQSPDGGTTWSTAVGILIAGVGSQTGQAIDMDYNHRAACLFLAINNFDPSVNAVQVLLSRDGGLNWSVAIA